MIRAEPVCSHPRAPHPGKQGPRHPRLSAKQGQGLRTSSLASLSAPAARSACTTSRYPFTAAMWSGVSAYCAAAGAGGGVGRLRANPTRRQSLARSGVNESSIHRGSSGEGEESLTVSPGGGIVDRTPSFASVLAPAARRAFATSTCPLSAALWSGVSRLCVQPSCEAAATGNEDEGQGRRQHATGRGQQRRAKNQDGCTGRLPLRAGPSLPHRTQQPVPAASGWLPLRPSGRVPPPLGCKKQGMRPRRICRRGCANAAWWDGRGRVATPRSAGGSVGALCNRRRLRAFLSLHCAKARSFAKSACTVSRSPPRAAVSIRLVSVPCRRGSGGCLFRDVRHRSVVRRWRRH